jgi:hypothetical protein
MIASEPATFADETNLAWAKPPDEIARLRRTVPETRPALEVKDPESHSAAPLLTTTSAALPPPLICAKPPALSVRDEILPPDDTIAAPPELMIAREAVPPLWTTSTFPLVTTAPLLTAALETTIAVIFIFLDRLPATRKDVLTTLQYYFT